MDKSEDILTSDEFRIFCFKVLPCSKRHVHDWTTCPYAHPGEKARRRDPRVFSYLAIPCPETKQDKACSRGDACPYSHSLFEFWLHPSRYKTQMCQHGAYCKRSICFFAHHVSDLRVPDTSHLKIEAEGPAAGIASAAAAQSQQQAVRRASGAATWEPATDSGASSSGAASGEQQRLGRGDAASPSLGSASTLTSQGSSVATAATTVGSLDPVTPAPSQHSASLLPALSALAGHSPAPPCGGLNCGGGCAAGPFCAAAQIRRASADYSALRHREQQAQAAVAVHQQQAMRLRASLDVCAPLPPFAGCEATQRIARPADLAAAGGAPFLGELCAESAPDSPARRPPLSHRGSIDMHRTSIDMQRASIDMQRASIDMRRASIDVPPPVSSALMSQLYSLDSGSFSSSGAAAVAEQAHAQAQAQAQQAQAHQLARMAAADYEYAQQLALQQHFGLHGGLYAPHAALQARISAEAALHQLGMARLQQQQEQQRQRMSFDLGLGGSGVQTAMSQPLMDAAMHSLLEQQLQQQLTLAAAAAACT